MTEPKYDEDLVNLGYLKKKIDNSEEIISIEIERIHEEAQSATEQASSKNKVFLTQPSNYRAGDMWILQTDTDHRAGLAGEMLISTAGRLDYDADDWINMLGYGSIRSINEVASNLNDAIGRIGDVEEAIEDGIIITYYQATIPDAAHIGDLWYLTDELEGYVKGKLYRWDGADWQELNDPSIQKAFQEANEARLIADGKIQSFFRDTQPSGEEDDVGVGDLWIDTDDNNKLYRYNGTNWVACYDTRIDTIETDIVSITQRTTSIETDLGEINERVEENTTTITTITGDLDNITNTKGSREGKNIHIEDSTEDTLISIKPNGETSQETRSGKNILKIINTTRTINGVTFTPQIDGGIIVNGTATANATYPLNVNSSSASRTINLLANTSYIISKSSESDISNILFQVYYKKNNTVLYSSSNLTTAEATTLGAYIRVSSGVTINNVKIYLQIEQGNQKTEYEEYGAMPSPEYPSPIVNIEGRNRYNRTLYPLEQGTIGSVIGNQRTNIASTTRLRASISFPVNPNTEYTLSVPQGFNLAIKEFDDDEKLITTLFSNWTSGNTATFITSSTTSLLAFLIKKMNDSTIINSDVEWVQLEEGTSVTDYVPYDNIAVKVENEDSTQSQTVLFPLLEGQKLYEGSYLADDGIHHTRGQIVLNGSEAWNLSTATGRYSFWIANTSIPNCKNDWNNKVCNLFKYEALKYSDASIPSLCENTYGTNIPMFVFNTNGGQGTSLAQWKTWLSTHPVTVEYELAEEEIIPYTTEQQEAWDNIKKLYTYYNITNIISDAYLEIEYVRDNGLDIYETKHNAGIQYTETIAKLAEQKITMDSINNVVSETVTKLNNDYLTAEQTQGQLDTLETNLETISEKATNLEQTSTQLQLDINRINSDGVTKVTTSTGFTFNEKGLSINKTGAETGTIIDEAGLHVKATTGDTDLLYAGYVKEDNTDYEKYKGQTIVAAANMIVKNYLVVPNSRFESYSNPVLGGSGTGVFGV